MWVSVENKGSIYASVWKCPSKLSFWTLSQLIYMFLIWILFMLVEYKFLRNLLVILSRTMQGFWAQKPFCVPHFLITGNRLHLTSMIFPWVPIDRFKQLLIREGRGCREGLPCSSNGKEFACNAGDPGLIPGSGRSSGEGNGNPLQYSCLGNPMDRGALWAIVYGITKSWTEQLTLRSDQIRSVAQSCPALGDPMNRSTPGLPVHHQLPEFTQTHVYRVSDAIQPSHPLSSPSPPAPKPSQHQGLFQWVNSSHEVAKVMEFQL